MASQRGPRGWKKRVKRVLLNVISLGRVCASVLDAEDASSTSRDRRERCEINAIQRENELLKEELRLKDDRMLRVSCRRRPHYSATDRMAILELKAARGWSTRETAQRFQVSEATIAAWLRKSDDPDSDVLLKLREPVNKYPDLIRVAVRRLKMLCPRLGKDKIAEMFCRAGVEISSSTVGRIVKERGPVDPRPGTGTSERLVTAKRPNEAWLIDLTTVPIGGFGFWIPWSPFSVAQCWPFCFWVGAVVDVYSRRVQGIAIFRKEPTARRIQSFLERVVSKVGFGPQTLVSDHDSVFDCEIIRQWCGDTTRQRFGAVGQKGSIAIIERFFLTLKNEFTRRILVSLIAPSFRREVRYFLEWFNTRRPHSGLAGKTPDEVYEGEVTRALADSRGVVRLEFYKRRRHLPVVTNRAAA